MREKVYACIDLKSFYASVECVERGLDPFKTDLVVSDPARGRGAICLAISPSMKARGVKNRCRIFEIPSGLEYITAMPRMKLYMRYSADIYSIYLKYISKDDIHVYSIDECFFDFTPYLDTYGMTPKELANTMMDAVFKETGIQATAGIGTNLFLAKVALDVTAKHAPDHIGFLDQAEFERVIWRHRPITDIWNVGKGIARRLEKYGVFDLYGVAHLDEKALYKEFGVNAEYLIDHAHGYEPCTIEEIHNYVPQSNSLSNGQVLFEDYNFDDALIVVREMVDMLVLELVEKSMVAGGISLHVLYSKDCIRATGGTRKLPAASNSYKKIAEFMELLYRETTDHTHPIHKLNVGLDDLTPEDGLQLDLFSSVQTDEKEQKIQRAVVSIKNKYGKSAILRGSSLQEKATARQRNKLVGGHNGE